jgi:hypothetical protein
MPDPRDRIDDPDAPASPEELEQADRLRAALADASQPNESAELARALSAAYSPRDLSAQEHGALVDRALSTAKARPTGRARVTRISFGTGAMLALAASVMLALWGDPRGDRRGPAAEMFAPALAVSRSTQDLFDAQFAPTGGETGRVDRIAMARATDLRDNEFARWGVR